MKSPTLKEHLQAKNELLLEYIAQEKICLEEASELYMLENATRPDRIEPKWGSHGPVVLQKRFVEKLRRSERFLPLFARDHLSTQWSDLAGISTFTQFLKEDFRIPLGTPVIVIGGLVNALPGTIAIKAPKPNYRYYHDRYYHDCVFVLPVWRPGSGILQFSPNKSTKHTYEPVCGLDKESKQDLEVAYLAYLDYVKKSNEQDGSRKI